jgi:Tfp pilus assembly PilM family ATPase
MTYSSKVNGEEITEAAPSLVIAAGLAMRGFV